MDERIQLKRTTTNDKDFASLVTALDNELWNELSEDKATYDPFNKVPGLSTAIVIYAGDETVACGCFKQVDSSTIEIKRMFVHKKWRRKGLSKLLLQGLENWAIEKGYKDAILETSIHFIPARTLYKSSGYKVIPNYPPYTGLAESICFKKKLKEE